MEPNDSSFSKLSELVARLERFERDNRDEKGDTRERSSRRTRPIRRKGSDSDSSTGNDGRGKEESDSSSEDERRRKPRYPLKSGSTFRPKGNRYNNLKPLKATDSRFKEVLDYRYYRLKRTSNIRDLGQLRHQVKRLLVTLRRHIFDGRDPILIVDFLRRYAYECDAQRMSEAQAHCALEYFLDGTASDHYTAVNNSSTADEGGVTCWPEAVHYLLRSYATHDAIREAALKLTNTRQGTTETEEYFSARLNNSAIRCGNVHSMDEKKTIFIDGLLQATKALVSRYREQSPRASYLELVQYASVEGRTHRARSGVAATPRKLEHTAKVNTPSQGKPSLLKQRKTALYAERSDASDGIFEPSRHANHTENMHLLGEHNPAYLANTLSDDTSQLPTTMPSMTTVSETDPALYVTPRSRFTPSGGQKVRPQRLTFDQSINRSRPGWEAPRVYSRPLSPGRSRIICHTCYVRDKHISPDCDLLLKDMGDVIRNFTALSAEEQGRVPATSYNRVRSQLDNDGDTPPRRNANIGDQERPRRSDEQHPAALERARSPNRSGN